MTGTIEPAGGGAPGDSVDIQERSGEDVDPSIMPNVAAQAHGSGAGNRKTIIAAVGLVFLAMVGVIAIRGFHRPSRNELPKTSMPGVAGSSGATQTFDTVPPAPATAASTAGADGQKVPVVPAIVPIDDDPVGLRGTAPSQGRGASGVPPRLSASAGPEKLPGDAPILLARPGGGGTAVAMGSSAADAGSGDPLAETQASLADYRHQLGRSLEQLQAMVPGTGKPGQGAPSSPLAGPTVSAGTSAVAGGVLGLQASDTPPVRARLLGDRSLLLPKGSALTCALSTRIVSAQAGLIGCQVLRNVYGSDGRVLLIERGSRLEGEYRVTQVKPGSTRIPALWTRLRTPQGVTVDLDSPATGPLGESGADAYVDNRWFERVGSAMLVSVLDDSIKIVLSNETAPQSSGNPVVFQGTGQTASHMAEKVLDATINLPPLLYANPGALVGVYVARDVDFSSVYELRPAEALEP